MSEGDHETPEQEGPSRDPAKGEPLGFQSYSHQGSSESTNISAGAKGELAKATDKPDIQTKLEEQSLLLACAQTKLVEAEVRSVTQDIDERKKYALCIFVLICVWVVGVFILIGAAGLTKRTQFTLPTPVLLAVVGSTTINVLGLFYIVAHYLFPARDASPSKHKPMAPNKT